MSDDIKSVIFPTSCSFSQSIELQVFCNPYETSIRGSRAQGYLGSGRRFRDSGFRYINFRDSVSRDLASCDLASREWGSRDLAFRDSGFCDLGFTSQQAP
ncbi:hypothetical protein B0T12DRAFT_193066 [Alternaria alternata]|jgi:hypothetical protein|nr:hypothetical protein B0T12DRAFT_193066 [Alternaria alternata]